MISAAISSIVCGSAAAPADGSLLHVVAVAVGEGGRSRAATAVRQDIAILDCLLIGLLPHASLLCAAG
jgi:hypothetical protein